MLITEIQTLPELLELNSWARPISYLIDSETGCWNVISHVPEDNGRIHVTRNRQLLRTHRYSYELAYGPIPDGLFVCHRCDNPRYINPEHLFLGTQRENMQDATQKGRMPYGEINVNSKLTETDVRTIRANTIFTQRKLARQYGVCQQQISHIKRGEQWGHIPLSVEGS